MEHGAQPMRQWRYLSCLLVPGLDSLLRPAIDLTKNKKHYIDDYMYKKEVFESRRPCLTSSGDLIQTHLHNLWQDL